MNIHVLKRKIIKGREIFLKELESCSSPYITVYIPYGSFVDGESQDFDFYYTRINPDWLKKFEKNIRSDGFRFSYIRSHITLCEHLPNYYGLKKIPDLDLCDQNDNERGVIAGACIKEQMTNVYAFLFAKESMIDINSKVLLETLRKNINKITLAQNYVTYRKIRNLSLALLQCKDYIKNGYKKFSPTKKTISNKYPQYKMLIYGDAKNPYNIMEGIYKTNEIKKKMEILLEPIAIDRFCKIAYTIKAEKLYVDAVEMLAKYHYERIREYLHRKNIRGVMATKFGDSCYVSITGTVTENYPICITKECPPFLFEEIKRKGEQVCIKNNKKAMEKACFDIHNK